MKTEKEVTDSENKQKKISELKSIPLELLYDFPNHPFKVRDIRLTFLVTELLELVDEGRMKMRPAVELSYLDEDCQRDLVDAIDEEDCTPTHAQAIRLRKQTTTQKVTTTQKQTTTKKVTTTEDVWNCSVDGHTSKTGQIGWVNSESVATDKALEYIANHDASGNFRVEQCHICGKYTAYITLD